MEPLISVLWRHRLYTAERLCNVNYGVGLGYAFDGKQSAVVPMVYINIGT